ncbi:hypothetical protein BGW38_003688, partial [Lunasporangiospora selenospora]
TGHLRAWTRRTIWCTLVIGVLCAIVLPIFVIYRKEGDNARSVVEVGPQGVSHTGDYIHVVGTVASVDFEDKNFRVHFEFTPHGTLAGDDGILAAAISISLFYTTLTFPEAQIMRSVDVTMPYMQGATIDYPFDSYKSYFEILANKEREQFHKIPVSLTFLGMLQSIEFIPTVRLFNEDPYKISIEIATRRSSTTIGFSLFIVMIMWAISIAIGIIAIQVVRRNRMSDEHVLTLGITTLFALPALRETQPGIPAIGCAADVLGFYWNMAIIAISSIMILMASALRWKEPSIEHELDMVRRQHDFQSKLISEMAIPMPFPLTGGPLSDFQLKKKMKPFVTTDHHHHHHHQYHQRLPGSQQLGCHSPPNQLNYLQQGHGHEMSDTISKTDSASTHSKMYDDLFTISHDGKDSRSSQSGQSNRSSGSRHRGEMSDQSHHSGITTGDIAHHHQSNHINGGSSSRSSSSVSIPMMQLDIFSQTHGRVPPGPSTIEQQQQQQHQQRSGARISLRAPEIELTRMTRSPMQMQIQRTEINLGTSSSSGSSSSSNSPHSTAGPTPSPLSSSTPLVHSHHSESHPPPPLRQEGNAFFRAPLQNLESIGSEYGGWQY